MNQGLFIIKYDRLITQQTTIVNIKVKELRKRGINSFQEWQSRPNTVYIGRNMNFYVPGAFKSKWNNKFNLKKYTREEALQLYEEYIRNTPELWNSLQELKGKELGCWCKPEACHGDILIKLLKEKEALSLN